jgi:ABC-type sugar transport system ATPase subunit
MANLRVRNLKKSFGSTRVIDNISFEIREGEFCILLGPSGCGKTTVLRLIAGLEEIDGGEIYIENTEVSGLTPRERDVAMVFQSYALYPHMNVYENMAFSLKIQKKQKEEINAKIKETATLLGLEDLLNRKPKELSGGQRQRVAIGRAIVRNPKLFLFDEPLSNLDAKLRSSMRVELARLHQKLKATTVYVTHDQVEAMTLGEKIILFDHGRIQQAGTPDELYNRPSNLFVATFIGSPRINLINGIIDAKDTDIFFKSGKLALNLGHRKDLRNFINREVTMGLRPEALSPGESPVKGNVELVEHLGPEALVHVRIDDTRLIAKAPPDVQADRGEDISLKFNERGMHFFNRGERIES